MSDENEEKEEAHTLLTDNTVPPISHHQLMQHLADSLGIPWDAVHSRMAVEQAVVAHARISNAVKIMSPIVEMVRAIPTLSCN